MEITKPIILLQLLLFLTELSFGQNDEFAMRLDSLVISQTQKPFHGIILVSQNNKTIYSKIIGFSDLEKRIPLTINDQFVIGSISKQITAVLVLQEMEKSHLKLEDPIHKYLPQLKEKWADSVTIHQLLTHTHGISDLEKPLAFKAGTQFLYSQIGYELLANIIEKTSGESFAALSDKLFKKCGMNATFHPQIHHFKNLVNGYTEQSDGCLKFEKESLSNYVAAGSFISTANDLISWNSNLHYGKLLADSTYQLMMTKKKFAVRQHPLFGITEYGYGITVNNAENLLQLGQTGFAPGFVSMDFYYPMHKATVVVLENIDWGNGNLKQTFYYHLQIHKIIRETLLSIK